jgi:hypothetical protein
MAMIREAQTIPSPTDDPESCLWGGWGGDMGLAYRKIGWHS